MCEPKANPPPECDKRRVLIVDDNPDAAMTTAMLLRVEGYETHVSFDGAEAVEIAAAIRPDVILLDIGMPKLDGYAVCRRLRNLESTRDSVIIALTGWESETHRRMACEAGFDLQFTKTVDDARLMEVLTTQDQLFFPAVACGDTPSTLIAGHAASSNFEPAITAHASGV